LFPPVSALRNLLNECSLSLHAFSSDLSPFFCWTYTDGSLQNNEVGQGTGSGVYHPHFHVSHYVNPKGMGTTNTISCAELAAIAAALIHRLLTYSHRQPNIAAPNQKAALTPKSLSAPRTSKEMSFNPLLKQSANHHSPSTFS